MSTQNIIILLIIIPTLGLFIQLKLQPKSFLPFDTNYWTMVTFFVTLVMCLFSWALVVKFDDNQADSNADTRLIVTIFKTISLFAGSLASTLLSNHPLNSWMDSSCLVDSLFHEECSYELLYKERFQITELLSKIVIKYREYWEKQHEDQTLPLTTTLVTGYYI